MLGVGRTRGRALAWLTAIARCCCHIPFMVFIVCGNSCCLNYAKFTPQPNIESRQQPSPSPLPIHPTNIITIIIIIIMTISIVSILVVIIVVVTAALPAILVIFKWFLIKFWLFWLPTEERAKKRENQSRGNGEKPKPQVWNVCARRGGGVAGRGKFYDYDKV